MQVALAQARGEGHLGLGQRRYAAFVQHPQRSIQQPGADFAGGERVSVAAGRADRALMLVIVPNFLVRIPAMGGNLAPCWRSRGERNMVYSRAAWGGRHPQRKRRTPTCNANSSPNSSEPSGWCLEGADPAVLAAAFPSLGIGFVGVALAFGLTVLTGAYALGPLSGGHFNPAVTAGVVAAERLLAATVVYVLAVGRRHRRQLSNT